MNAEQIDQTFNEKFGENNDLLAAHYDGVQRELDLSEDARAERAIEGHRRGSAYLVELETWRTAALEEREADLRDDLFAAATVNGFDGSVVKEDANAAQLAALDATDEKLQLMASRAAKTKNTTLAKAVAAEADARERPDLALSALGWLPAKREAYTELMSVPTAEERAERLDRAQTSIPLPSMARLRPTLEQRETASRIEAANRAQRARFEG
jgi:predicted transcriptional regulator